MDILTISKHIYNHLFSNNLKELLNKEKYLRVNRIYRSNKNELRRKFYFL
jgi:hypothetical protein